MRAATGRSIAGICLAIVAGAAALPAQAAEWSDNTLSWRKGSAFREPFNQRDIRKDIVALTHASGYKYGSNYFNVDFLLSDSNDPGSLGQSDGAQESYVVYRHTLDIGKLSGNDFKIGAVRGVGATFGFDMNTKNDVGYNSRKRMLVAGPTLMWDVPGFLNTSVLLMNESNAPSGAFPPISLVRERYTYDLHPMLSASWGIPVGALWKFEGYANLIAAKGKDEVGFDTGPETNIDMQLMFDAGAALGQKKNMFRIGIEYQYWNNKFGNTSFKTNGNGFRAKTPMIRAAIQF